MTLPLTIPSTHLPTTILPPPPDDIIHDIGIFVSPAARLDLQNAVDHGATFVTVDLNNGQIPDGSGMAQDLAVVIQGTDGGGESFVKTGFGNDVIVFKDPYDSSQFNLQVDAGGGNDIVDFAFTQPTGQALTDLLSHLHGVETVRFSDGTSIDLTSFAKSARSAVDHLPASDHDLPLISDHQIDDDPGHHG